MFLAAIGSADRAERPALPVHHADSGDAGSRMRTSPAVPSTRRRSPSLICSVAAVTPTTQEIPSSRATMAVWDKAPPEFATMPLAMARSGPQGGAVARHTTMSPEDTRSACSRLTTTRARSITTHGLAAVPRKAVAVSATGRSRTAACSWRDGPPRLSGGSNVDQCARLDSAALDH